jgi:hypothetical protein
MTEREKIQTQVIEYALRGYDFISIAKHLAVLPATVSRIVKTKGLADAAKTARDTVGALPELPPTKRSDLDALRLVKQSIRTVGIEDVADDLEDSGVHSLLVGAFLKWLRSPEAERRAVNIGLSSAVLGEKTVSRVLSLLPIEVRAAWTIAGEPSAIRYQPEDPEWWLRYALRFGAYAAMDMFEERLNSGERQRFRRLSRKYKGRAHDHEPPASGEASSADEPAGDSEAAGSGA